MWLPLAFCLSSAMIVLAPYIAWRLRVDRQRTEAWAQWASSRGFEFVARSGPIFARVGERVRGDLGGLQIELDLCRVANGNRGILYTRLVATGDELAGAPIEIRERSFVERLNTFVLANWVEIDDAEFAEDWLARGERRDEVLALLGDDLRRALRESRRIESVRIEGGRLEILIRGEPADHDVFDRALDVATAAWSTKQRRVRLAS